MEIRRSIQDIIPPARSKPIRTPIEPRPGPTPVPPSQSTPPPVQPPTPPSPMDLNPNRPRGMFAVTLVAIGVIAIALVAIGIMSTVFHRAYVTVIPYHYDVVAATTITSATDSLTLPYQKAGAEETLTKSVPATGTKQAEDRASGTITVYNAYSTKPERLITNTRFATKEGLIFRVHNAVVVPGYTVKAGLKVPGSAEIVVYADEPGEKYNVGITDFTIPGLKGSKQYDLMTAHSKTPMTGGFIGEKAVVDDAVRAQAVESLRADLDRTLRTKMLSSVVDGNVIFPSSIVISFTEGPDKADGENAVISVSGTAIAPMFDANAFAHALSQSVGSDFDGKILIKNPNDLEVRVTDSASLQSGAEISLTVSGTANVVAQFDAAQLAKDLAGKSKTDVSSVRAAYPSIESFEVSVYPFWRGGSIPSSTSKITITESGKEPAEASLDQ